ncbi:MAG: hypothetical protein IPH06_04640 [Alphaproteobacteria bacterium]|jgi:hypothetical protein|nr:hypothetical protein [Alphaproteobacteria bacterium]QQS57315.1 MAG: hypothetical protein IPN28_00400 [Alphaproteobacteria bacterium]
MITGLFGQAAEPLTAQGIGGRFAASASTGANLDAGLNLTTDIGMHKDM